MVLYYFYRANKVFHYPTFVSNVELKVAERGFRDDVRTLMRHGTELDWETACQQVLAYFEFLGDLDDRDQLFLDLAKALLGKPYPKAKELSGPIHHKVGRHLYRVSGRPSVRTIRAASVLCDTCAGSGPVSGISDTCAIHATCQWDAVLFCV